MNLSQTTGAFIHNATAAKGNYRPCLVYAEISTKNVPFLPLEAGQGVIAATDGYRLHISRITLNGSLGLVSVLKNGKEWATVAAPDDMGNFPDYNVCIPVHNLTTGPLLDWPTISEATAKGLSNAGVWATLVEREGEVHFTGFHTSGSASIKQQAAAGALRLNPLYTAQAIGASAKPFASFSLNISPQRPVCFHSENGDNLAVVVADAIPDYT